MKNGLLRALLGAAVVVLLSASSSYASVRPPVSVPEPASMTLLAIGGASAFLFKRRRS